MVRFIYNKTYHFSCILRDPSQPKHPGKTAEKHEQKSQEPKSPPLKDGYRTIIRVLKAENVKKGDWFGKSDAFCVVCNVFCILYFFSHVSVIFFSRQVKVDNSEERNTKVVPNNLSPQWKEDFTFDTTTLPKLAQFAVRDDDKRGKSQGLGEATVDLKALSRLYSKPTLTNSGARKLPILYGSAKKRHGTLYVMISGQVIGNPKPESGPKFKTIVTVIKGSNLRKGDTFSQSDAFCIVEVGQKAKPQQTNVIKDNKNPVWNETVCAINIPKWSKVFLFSSSLEQMRSQD